MLLWPRLLLLLHLAGGVGKAGNIWFTSENTLEQIIFAPHRCDRSTRDPTPFAVHINNVWLVQEHRKEGNRKQSGRHVNSTAVLPCTWSTGWRGLVDNYEKLFILTTFSSSDALNIAFDTRRTCLQEGAASLGVEMMGTSFSWPSNGGVSVPGDPERTTGQESMVRPEGVVNVSTS